MNILFDLVTPQGFIGGAGEYVRKVFYSLLDKASEDNSITLYVAIDSTLGRYAYLDLAPESLERKPVRIIDLGKQSLSSCIREYKIDTLFIGVGQEWGDRYDVEKLKCKVICVIHDINDYEYRNNKLRWYLLLDKPWIFFKKMVRRLLGMDNYVARLDRIITLYNNNNNTEIVTVSNYSKLSIEYLLGIDSSRVCVLYSPERVGELKEYIENRELKEIIDHKKKYYLFLSANRLMKNPQKVLAAFEKYVDLYDKDAYIVTTGNTEQKFHNHIVLPYLSDSDLMNAYKHCYAFIFGSFFEGFGYPPMEAMRFCKPVLASNVTSIPEILGDSAIYFSPIYESDIFRCLVYLKDSNYEEFALKSKDRYTQISRIQRNDLETLINKIIE